MILVKLNFLITFIFSLLVSVGYKVNDSTVAIKGTSTLHDWEMKTTDVTGTANFEIDHSEINSIKSLSISIPAEGLKSDKAAMDKNAYKALRSNDHKNIVFKMTRLSRIEKITAGYKITCEGTLEIAGTSRTTEITAICSPTENGSIKCKGEKSLKMSDYKVEAPSFMFGSVKTGDEIKIEFDVVLNKI